MTLNEPKAEFTVDALIRSMGVNPPCRHMLFLGAGASITSGIPSAWQCVWRWKREIFLSAQPGISPLLLGDPTLPHVQQRIQRWLDANGGFPSNSSDSEYQFYAKHCFPLPNDRQKFFEQMIVKRVPSIGYQALGLLIEAGHFHWIWTTNFDDLVERGRPAERSRVIKQVGMDSKHRLEGADPHGAALHHVLLHGDFRYDSLRNTDEELQTLDAEFREAMGQACAHHSLVIAGYSGRDESIMNTLEAAYSRPGTGGLYWLQLAGTESSTRVLELISRAQQSRRHAAIIEYEGFDAFMMTLGRYLLRAKPWAQRLEELARAQPEPKVSFALTGYKETPEIVKSNSWLVRVPDHIYQLEVPSIQDWAGLREMLSTAQGRVVAGLMKGKVLALGMRADLATCFGEQAMQTLQQVPVTVDEMFWEDGVVLSTLREALVRTFENDSLRVAKAGRHWFIVDTTSRSVQDGHVYYEAAEIRVEQRGGQLFLSVLPDRYLPLEEQPEQASHQHLAAVKNRLLSRQWNQVFNDELNKWRKLLGLKGKGTTALVYPPQAETGFRFTIEWGPVFTQVFSRQGRPISPTGVDSSLYRFKAFRLPEPSLRFHGGEDIHPIRGLTSHGPVELGANIPAGPSTIRLGVIAPRPFARTISIFLRALLHPHKGIETKSEYLHAYPGFAAAFRLPLEVPTPGDPAWVEVPIAPSTSDPVIAFREVLGSITRSIDRLASGPQVDVVTIFIPQAWAWFERIETEEHDLNLHDHLKAYCAAQGIRTQLLREETLGKRQRAEVLWWLSLAFYAKSLRTPWLLASAHEDVAYIGIGYAMARTDPHKPIVLGCSHVFQSSGLGLRFQLSHVKEPIFRRRKPYLGRDDALRLGVQTRQLILESSNSFPQRALVCKRTPFIREELDGFRAGLHGIGSIDTLTIEYDPAWRYIAWDTRAKNVAMFPVQRGTVILIDDDTFLLWVHGRVDRINERGHAYYQGKTRIPTPLRIRRYSGSTPIEQLAQDLLGLSKMDWNTFDLYETMPAHVTTPNTIARIGRFLERLSPMTLDYRLFM